MLLLVMLLCTSSALAAGKIEATQTNMVYSDNYHYFYARVENTGDADISTGLGTLLLYDENGEELYKDNFIGTTPSDILLKPGEHAYISTMVWGLPSGTEVASYSFSIASENDGSLPLFLPAEVTCDITYSEDSYYNKYFVTLTNNTDSIAQDCEILVAAFDGQNNLISVAKDSLYGIGLYPGSKVTRTFNISKETLLYCLENDVKIETLEVQVLYNP